MSAGLDPDHGAVAVLRKVLLEGVIIAFFVLGHLGGGSLERLRPLGRGLNPSSHGWRAVRLDDDWTSRRPRPWVYGAWFD